MREQSRDPKAASRDCSDWTEIVQCLEAFPPAEVNYTDGYVTKTAWVFRGLTDSCFNLEPAIEREARSKEIPWFALERLVASEFKSRARMHLTPTLVPDPQDEFTWLAQMQHYGIPTRLLDFTYSPFVALYFAIREQRNDCSSIRLWAIDATAVNDRFWYVASKEKHQVVSWNPDHFSTAGDDVVRETQGLQTLIAESLLATGSHRAELERRGCVAVASPPAFNPRLASQQGVFLVNCAEGLTFCESLNTMMASCKTEWCKRFDIAVDAAPDIEQRLFQMNIHEQSLFPDMKGLAGFIRQKIRLHWK